MPHLVYYVAASLDGRIAGPQNALGFLESIAEPESYGADAFEPFFENVDALVMGARTFAALRDAVASGEAEAWPYGGRRTVVMTREDTPTGIAGAEIEHFSGGPRDLVEALDAAGVRRLWLVGGGTLAGGFLADDLVDEIVLTLAPTILGAGPSLADHPALPLRDFALSGVTRGTNSVALRYRRLRQSSGRGQDDL